MKSFKEYLIENWSIVNSMNDIPMEDRHRYLYHVTTSGKAKKIVKQGLIPRTSVKGNYGSDIDNLSYGRAFVTSHHGIPYWVHSLATRKADKQSRNVEEKDYEKLRILKFPVENLPKSVRRKLNVDTFGTRDANSMMGLSIPFNPQISSRAYNTEMVVK